MLGIYSISVPAISIRQAGYSRKLGTVLMNFEEVSLSYALLTNQGSYPAHLNCEPLCAEMIEIWVASRKPLQSLLHLIHNSTILPQRRSKAVKTMEYLP
jgi:hypothetical protein